jgi:hypothetical protein
LWCALTRTSADSSAIDHQARAVEAADCVCVCVCKIRT